MVYPLPGDYEDLIKEYDIVPVWSELLSDVETPVSVFYKIARRTKAFLLESAEYEEKIGRFSFIIFEPQLLFEQRSGLLYIRDLYSKSIREVKTNSPLDYINRNYLDKTIYRDENIPPFCGGVVGYVGYDYVKYIEPGKLGKIKGGDFPELMLYLANSLIVFDNYNQKIKVVVNTFKNSERNYKWAITKINRVIDVIRGSEGIGRYSVERASHTTNVMSNFIRDDFEIVVNKAKRYIYDGDIFQVVLSQRFEAPLSLKPFHIYRQLRVLNPSPYMFYFNFDRFIMLGASPEMMVRVNKDRVFVRPIAGTRKRGRNEEEDKRLEKELLSDEKERAEHIMLVDLGRNDIGRIANIGSVKVNNLMHIERYSHVMHIVSEVEGVLKSGYDWVRAFESAFPAGTVSGAPKIRAMEIIDELEPDSRGPYAGSVLYASYGNYIDSCITIRTMICKGDRVFVQAGAGIVADSDPKREYIETQNKASALFAALNIAKKGEIL